MKRSELLFMFLLVPVDVVMILASLVAGYFLRAQLLGGSAPAWGVGVLDHFRYALYLLPAWVAVLALNGLYEPTGNQASFSNICGIFLSNCVVMFFLGMVGVATGDPFFSGSMVLWTLVLSVILMFLGRVTLGYAQRYLFDFGIGRKNVLLIGSGAHAAYVAQELRQHPALGMKVVGLLGDGPRGGDKVVYLGDLSRLDEVITDYLVDEVMVVDGDLAPSEMTRIIGICSDRSLTIDFVPAGLCQVSPRVKTSEIGAMPVLRVQTIPLDGWGRILKRIFDFTFALGALVVLSPVILTIAALEKLTSRGPVFYAQNRVGRDGRRFKVYKFRSMYTDQCDFAVGGSKWTTAADEETRITPFGRFLRKTNLDEIPQLWNILVGNMSLVGPRPEQPKFVQQFTEEIPDYHRRHRVKSGLTGWAQVHGLKGDTSIPERVKYDLYYIENWSLWLDLRIILMTFAVVAYEMFGGKYEYRARA
jgi:exopolysaccharide biosynthesis polyprenyl glycosylphosphotransferase